MAHFTSYDGAKLAFHRTGSGPPLVCLPGGPGRPPATWAISAGWTVPAS